MSSDNEYEVINYNNSNDDDLLEYSESDLYVESDSESDNRTMPENIKEKCKQFTSEIYNEIYTLVLDDLLLGDSSDIESYKEQLEQAKQKILKLTSERDQANENSMRLSLEIDKLLEEIESIDVSEYKEKNDKLEEINRSLSEQLEHQIELNKHISIDTRKLQQSNKQIEMLELENEKLKRQTQDYYDLENKLNELVIENDGLKTKNNELLNTLYSSEYKSKTEYNTMKSDLESKNNLLSKQLEDAEKEEDAMYHKYQECLDVVTNANKQIKDYKLELDNCTRLNNELKLKLEHNESENVANNNLNTLSNACELVEMTNWVDRKQLKDNCVERFDETTKEYALKGYAYYKQLDYKNIDINDVNRSSCGIEGWAKYYEEVLGYQSKLSSKTSKTKYNTTSKVTPKRYNLRPRK